MASINVQLLAARQCLSCHRLAMAWIPHRNNSNRASISRIKRNVYLRQYPCMLVLPDGSSINIRYKEPRKIIKLPVDLNILSEAERKLRLLHRKPKQKFVVDDELDDDRFDANQYRHMLKK